MKRRRADGQLTIADAFSRAKPASKSADSDTTAAVDDTTFGQGFSSANVCARASSWSLDEAAAAGAGIRSSAEEPPTSDGDHEDDVGKLFLEADRRHVGSSGPARGFSLQHLTRDGKAFLLQNHFRPGESFEFPCSWRAQNFKNLNNYGIWLLMRTKAHELQSELSWYTAIFRPWTSQII